MNGTAKGIIKGGIQAKKIKSVHMQQDPGNVGMKRRMWESGIVWERRMYGIDKVKKKIQGDSNSTLSSLGGLDWDLSRMFPAPPLPEE